MKAENLGRLSLLVSVLPLTLFIIRHLKIGMDAPWVYIIFAVYALLIIAGFVFAIRSVYKELHADHETGAADNK